MVSEGIVIGSDTLTTSASSGYANVRTVSSNYTATSSDYVILVNAAGGDITISLPSASTVTGKLYSIVKIDATGNTVTIDPSGSETISGSTTIPLSDQWGGVKIISDGSNWVIVP